MCELKSLCHCLNKCLVSEARAHVEPEVRVPRMISQTTQFHAEIAFVILHNGNFLALKAQTPEIYA
jgi:hypothetical protein